MRTQASPLPGIPVPSTEVKLLDEYGKDLPLFDDEVSGELCIKGPQVMKGYWQRPEETALTIKDGWVKTGDIAIIKSNGYLKIVDRKKDMIIVSGFNVYPNELEDVITSHPDILECAAIGIDNPVSGQDIKVFIVANNKNLTKENIIDYCRKNLTKYKIPRIIEFREELPKTNVGKILRRKLREESESPPTHARAQ